MFLRSLLTASLAFAAVPAAAQERAAPPVTGAPRTILFVGNSFTQGAHSAVRNYRANTVTDLNGDGYGGVPALFKRFTEEAGQNWQVSLETQGGKSLGFHYAERRQKLGGRWDAVVLQEYSTLDRERPGDPRDTLRSTPLLAQLFTSANPTVNIQLMATWSRADATWQPKGDWYGKRITQMAADLRAGMNRVRAAVPAVRGVLPVGEAWNRAFAKAVFDPNPYDGITYGQLDPWAYDHYHASVAGYYLEALVVFGRIAGVDPRSLGPQEKAADDLGLSEQQTSALQQIAWEQLQAG
ncbi:PEP-CTERM sorting domain-containing protein [Sphingomonas aracearum]|uniref:PEP-CTERM sorting domain-containing protein n=1 Tax=Sphingomonas aracearum TaxID=2283317 RepID=A0A369VZJ8_9SPHN|nr:PEP-CTERM sorting domain-containing protein [Sphingomonas aracearum]RDE07057.1 PEP-CTERM sorting domain-containing protein [Sphingomonas aracearum]